MDIQLGLVAPPGSEHIMKPILAGSWYELAMLEDMKSRLSDDGSTIYDVGAFIGTTSLWLDGHFNSLTIMAFEPSPIQYNALVLNVHLHEARVRTFPFALGSKEGRGKILRSKDSQNAGMDRVVLPGDPEWYSTDYYKDAGNGGVPIFPLDFFQSQTPVSCIKIDAEGMEWHVLQGAAKTLEEWHPLLYVESEHPQDREDVEEYLHKFGYTCFGKFNDTPTYGYKAK